VEIRPLTEAHAEAIATWRYPDQYSTYDIGEIVTAADGYSAVKGAETRDWHPEQATCTGPGALHVPEGQGAARLY